jgi:cytochrome b561
VPPDEPSLTRWHRAAAHANHWSLYALLVAVPITGWLGGSKYPALEVFGLFRLPALAAPDKAAGEELFELHETLVFITLALVAIHVAAALFHYFIRRDGVLSRMIPALRRP